MAPKSGMATAKPTQSARCRASCRLRLAQACPNEKSIIARSTSVAASGYPQSLRVSLVQHAGAHRHWRGAMVRTFGLLARPNQEAACLVTMALTGQTRERRHSDASPLLIQPDRR